MDENQKDLPKPQTDLPTPENSLPAGRQESSQVYNSDPAFQGETLEPQKKKRSFPVVKILIAIFIILLVIMSIGAAYFFLNQNKTTDQFTETEISTDAEKIDPTANWEIYENTAIGFIIKYPQRYPKPQLPSGAPGNPPVYADGTELDNSIIFAAGSSRDAYYLDIFPSTDTLNQIIEDHIQPIEKIKESKVSGADAIWYRQVYSIPTNTPRTTVFFKNNDYGFRLLTNKVDPDEEIDQILSTFKFIEQNSAVNTLSNLTFKIPAGWWIGKPNNRDENKKITSVSINPVSMDECCWDWGPAIIISHIPNSNIDTELEDLQKDDGSSEKFENKKIEYLNVGDKKAAKFTATKLSMFIGEVLNYENIYIQDGKDIYAITSDSLRFTTASDDQKKIIEQMLKDLKFIN